MRTVQAVWLAVMLSIVPVSKAENLPGGCAIIATQTYIKVEGTSWRALISIQYIDRDSFPLVHGHMICIWQPFEGSHILVYNLHGFGTIELKTSSHDITEITKFLAGAGNFIIVASRFIE